MSVQPGDLLTHVHMWRVLESMPQYGDISGHIWQDLFPPDQSPSPHIMWKLLRSEANLAGFLSVDGVAIPVERLESDREFADMANIGASWRVDPQVVQAALDPAAAAMIAIDESPSGQELLRMINDEMTGGIANALLQMERQREYMAMQAIRGQMTWPPVDQNGNAITDPMEHWNPGMVLNFSYSMDSDFVQSATTLFGWDFNDGNGPEPGGRISWAQPGATMIRDLRLINRFMYQKRGLNARDGRMIMTPFTFETMCDNNEIREVLLGKDKNQPGARDYLDIETVGDYVRSRIGWNLQIYEAAPWTYRTITSGRVDLHPVRFLPDGVIIFIPSGITPGAMMECLHETQDETFAYGNIPWLVRGAPPMYIRTGGVRAVAWPAFPYSNTIFVFNAFS